MPYCLAADKQNVDNLWVSGPRCCCQVEADETWWSSRPLLTQAILWFYEWNKEYNYSWQLIVRLLPLHLCPFCSLFLIFSSYVLDSSARKLRSCFQGRRAEHSAFHTFFSYSGIKRVGKCYVYMYLYLYLYIFISIIL